MAILNIIKKGYIHLKVGGAYIKLLPRTLATLVSMSDGRSVENAIDELNRNLEATKNNLSGLQVLECGSKIITTPNGLYTLKGDLPEGRSYVAHVINGDYNANPAKIEKVIIQDNNVVVQFVGAVNNPYRINYVIFSVP